MNGLFGGMTQQANAASAGLPGFNYVPPQVGPAPVAAPVGVPNPAGGGGMMTPGARQAMQFGAPLGPGQDSLTPQQLQVALRRMQRGRGGYGGGGNYTTSGPGGSGSSSSARGGGFSF
jgi:hypothetical protein